MSRKWHVLIFGNAIKNGCKTKIQSKMVAGNWREVYNLQRGDKNEKLCVLNNGY